MVALGPGSAPGSLLNLDLSVTPTLRVPPGIWGLGPALPQRVPEGLPLAWLGTILGGPTTWKLAMVLAFAAAFAGAVRLAARAALVTQVGAGLLYAFGPFALTRASVGHLHVLLLLAVLPFALPSLLRPADRVSRTYVWALAMSLTGAPGGVIAALALAVGMVADRGRRAGLVLGAFALSTLVWLAPSLAVLPAGAQVSGSGSFATAADGVGGMLRLLMGGGFWRPVSELGASGPLVAAFGVIVLALAAVGHRQLPASWRGRALAAALVGMAVTLATALPGVRDGYRWFTDLPIGAPFRESQRGLVLWLVWLAPASALGAGVVSARLMERAARQSRRSSGAGVAVWAGLSPVVLIGPALGVALVAAPGLWGAGGAYQPVEFPHGWATVRQRVARAPGPVLALPWKEYLDLSFAGGRRCLNPLPDYLGGDVLSSYDPEFGQPVQEQVDRRAERVDALIPGLLRGSPVSTRLRALGLRWIVLAHESTPLAVGAEPAAVIGRSTWERYRASLTGDAGLEQVASTASIELWRVRGWRGPAVGPDGKGYGVDGLLAPLHRTSAPPGSLWLRAGAPGWVRGLQAAPVTADGLTRLPGRSTLVWYWPTVLVLVADGMVTAGLVVAVVRLTRRTAPPPAGDPPAESPMSTQSE